MAHIKEEPLPDVGVMIGRFQVPELHEGHRDVLDYVAERHDKKLLILGNADHGMATESNPLDFTARKQMIESEYPEFDYFYIKDEWSNEYWSRKLDELIRGAVSPGQSVLLYGSRDSFIPHYKGKYPTQELEADFKISGTEIRAEIKRKRPTNSADWRMGATHAAGRRFPTTYPTVDVVVYDEDKKHIVLVKKPNEPFWRIPGGFAEPSSETYEADARREVEEETNLSITDPVYIGSRKIDDWRYRGERDKIKTLLFVAKKMFGELRAADDVEFAEWFKIDTLDIEKEVMPNHRPLVEMAIEHLKGTND